MNTTHKYVAPRGFTLLFAVLVGSILLALGYAIFNIVSKDVLLSSSGRDSQFAFYAADSGIECALYWDYQEDAFATTSALTSVACGESDATLTREYQDTTYVTTFSFSLGDALSAPCATIDVYKTPDPVRTVVVSAGYNTCVTSNPRRIERAIRVQY